MRLGTTVYPVKPGVILKLKTPFTCKNRKINATAEHTVFIWIQKAIRRDLVRRRVVHDKERILRVMYCYVPQIEGATLKTIERVRRVQLESITKALKVNGFELVADNCNFYDKFQDYKRFYRRIGII